MRIRSLIMALAVPVLLVLLIQHSPGVLVHLNQFVHNPSPPVP